MSCVYAFYVRSARCLSMEDDCDLLLDVLQVAGIAFSPDSEAFFVGIEDVTYGSLLEFNRNRAARWQTSQATRRTMSHPEDMPIEREGDAMVMEQEVRSDE